MSKEHTRSAAGSELLWGAGAAVSAFAVYIATLCPTLSFIDSGELATVAYTLGVAHPTGYPLFTLSGWVFSHLPLGLGVIYQLNLMSAFFCSAALMFFFMFASYLISQAGLKRSGTKHAPPASHLDVLLPALVGTLALGLSATYWSQAVAVEVYSLHLLCVCALLCLYARAVVPLVRATGRDEKPADERLLLAAFAFVLGLSFTNHMTTIFLAPAFLYLFFAAYGFSREAWRRIAWMAAPFLAGLSLYLYLPFRASEQPVLNWGNTVTWDAFFRHTSAKQYSVWLFSSAETAKRQLGHFLSAAPEEFVYAAIPVALAGAWSLFRRERKIFLFTLLLFLGCVLYAINYDIHDIDSYFLLAYLTIALWTAFGLRHMLGLVRSRGARRIVAAAAVACLLGEGAVNAGKVTLHDMHLVEDYTRDMFRSVEPKAIIITYQWDYFVSASYYAQIVESARPDVIVIDKELLRRTWYFAQLERRHPEIIARSRPEVTAFLAELRKFENGVPYDPQTIEFRFASLIRSFIEKNLDGPVYVTPEIEPQYTAGFRRIPSGLAERITREGLDAEITLPEFQIRRPGRSDAYVDGLIGLYAQAYLRAALYERALARTERARELVARALRVDPAMPQALLLGEELKKELKGGS